MATAEVGGRPGRKPRWIWLESLVLGGAIALLGIFALGAAPMAGALTVVTLGVLLIAAGALELFHALAHKESPNRLLFLLSGILSAVVGVLMVSRVGVGLAAITLLLAGYFIANGLFHGIAAIAERYPLWGLDLALGLASTLLGVIVIGRWPVSSLWMVGTLVGLEMLSRGLTLMVAGISLRRVFHGHGRAPLRA